MTLRATSQLNSMKGLWERSQNPNPNWEERRSQQLSSTLECWVLRGRRTCPIRSGLHLYPPSDRAVLSHSSVHLLGPSIFGGIQGIWRVFEWTLSWSMVVYDTHFLEKNMIGINSSKDLTAMYRIPMALCVVECRCVHASTLCGGETTLGISAFLVPCF